MIDMTKRLDPSDTMQIFLEAVRLRMDALEIRQVDLCDRLGMKSAQLSPLLNGKRGNCSTSQMDRISKALGTTTVDLLSEYSRAAA